MQKIITLLLSILVSTSLSFADGNENTKSNSRTNRAEKTQDRKDKAASPWTWGAEKSADTNKTSSSQSLLKSNSAADITDITLPFDETDIELSESTASIITVDMWEGEQYPGHVYRFTLEDDAYLRIAFNQDLGGFITKSTTLSEANIISEFYLNGIPVTSGKLEAGTYYLFILYYDEYISYSLNVYEHPEPKVYTGLDYTTMLTKGESKSGKVNMILEPIVLTPYWDAPGSAFSMEVEEGQAYFFTYDVYLPEASHIFTEISFFKDREFQGDKDDFKGDLIRSEGKDTYIKQLSSNSVFHYQADFTGTLRILLQANAAVSEFTYTIRVDETEFSFVPISIPYSNEELVFLPNSVYRLDNGEKALGFTFSLDKETTLAFQGYNDYYDWEPMLSIYDNENLQNPIEELEWLDGYHITLSAGDYYILVSDNGFKKTAYYTCPLSIYTIPNYISVTELLNAATAIDYGDLPLFKDGNFAYGSASIVRGDGGFRSYEGLYFAEAYKLTLNANDKLIIHHSSLDFDAYLYFYGKNNLGGFTRLNYNDDGTSAYNASTGKTALSGEDSFLEFVVAQGGDYYIIATSYYTLETGAYSLNIWSSGDGPATSYITVAELLDAAEDISYGNLPVIKETYFDYGTTSLVAGDGGFRNIYGRYFAEAYKISLNVGDKLKIHHSHEHDAFLYVYFKNENGDYEAIIWDDDGYADNSRDAYLEFTIKIADDYYIIATTYYLQKHGASLLRIWETGDAPLYKITSLSSPSNKIVVSPEATEMERLLALTKLRIEGKTNEGKTLSISNSPYFWTISEDAKSATFVPHTLDPYEISPGLSLVVLLDDETSIESINDQEQNRLNVYTVNRSIIIENAALGANLAVYDIAGHLLVNKQVNAVPETVSVPNAGVYIVRVGTEVVKVICR